MNELPHKAIGYTHLIKAHGIETLPFHVRSYLSPSSRRQTNITDGIRVELFPRQFWPGESDFGHLSFALKHEGLNLPFLRAFLPRLSGHEVKSFVQDRPTGGNSRRIWLLYEAFTGKELDMPDLKTGRYFELLDSNEYITLDDLTKQEPRYRIYNNVLGTLAFCPIVRKSALISDAKTSALAEKCKNILSSANPEIMARTLNYLYSKETKSSYEIENETAEQSKSLRFIEVLKHTADKDYLTKEVLIELQNLVVAPQFRNNSFRSSISEQNYVGRTISIAGDQEVHFISPKPEDIDELMGEFLNSAKRISDSLAVNPIVAAAAIAYPFVFLHPFSDGNGRLHRFLIHYVLTKMGFTPEGVIFPVSAAILRKMSLYDRSLESFSRKLMPLIEYKFDKERRITVLNRTVDYYRHIDCTTMAEALFEFITDTIEKDLPEEISFLKSYDEARKRMSNVLDMPNRQADLFIRLCVQNGLKLSKVKRKLPDFAILTDEEIAGLEGAVQKAFKGLSLE